MSLVFNEALIGAAGQGGAYQIEQSLRFDGSSYLTRTNSSAPSNQYKATFSVWVKVDGRKVDTDNYILQNGVSGTPYSNAALYYETNSGWYQFVISNNSNPSTRTGRDSIRDHSAWYHLVFTFDHTQSSSEAGMKLYVNGQQRNGSAFGGETAGGWSDAQNQPVSFLINGRTLGMGRSHQSSNAYFAGYMAEFHCVDGQVLTPSDFGEYDDNGVWRPIEYSGTYGNNGWYLKYDSSATNGIGHDHSGNGNNWTPTGFTTSGTGTDVMDDTPTNNFCTINPLAYAYVYYAANAPKNGNLEVIPRQSYSGNWTHGVGTFPLTSGKWYFEIENDGGTTNNYCGLYQVSDNTSWPWNQETSSYQYVYQSSNGYKRSSSSSTYGASWSSAGDIVGVAYDGDNGTLTFYKNGTSQGTAFTGLTGTYVPRVQSEDNSGAKLICNFGQRAFAYTPPTGFKALSTSNIPAPTIKDGSKYFNTVLWTGNGSSQSVTGVGFQPDFLWTKARNQTYWHRLHDAVRGRLISLYSNESNAEASQANSITSFDSDGFTLGSDGSHNGSGVTYVGWSWLAGNGTSSNTNGSITSTVSANPSAGFSIVTYTAENAVRTIGHGLGVAPKLIIVKNRDATQNWAVYHGSLGATKGLYLDLSAKQETNSGYWNNTEPTSTVFTVGTNTRTGGTTNNYVAYCFAEVEGYSKFGLYRGNGSTDGFVCYTGFKPAWVMVKTYAGGSEDSWYIWDNKSDPYNYAYHYLRADAASAQNTDTTNARIDMLANGFKIRQSSANINESGSDYVFIAFAENPFGGSGVTPATAR